MKVEQKIALVTGGNKGIGYETARRLGLLGLTVWIGCRDRKRGHDAADHLMKLKIDARPIILDVTNEKSIAQAAKEISKKSGRLDILVNNAGIVRDNAPPSKVEVAVVKETFETNFFGSIRVTQLMLPLLSQSKCGRIVNVSSGLGSLTQHSDPNYEFAQFKALAYPCSKAALNMATIMFAAELLSRGIKVNAADPGYTATDFNNHNGTRSVEQGADIVVKLATLPDDGPTGGYFDDKGAVPW